MRRSKASVAICDRGLLKNLTFQDPPERRSVVRAVINQPSGVSKRQLAPEKTHLSRFFDPKRLLKKLTFYRWGPTNTIHFAALRQTPGKAHLDTHSKAKSPTQLPRRHHPGHSCAPVKAHLSARQAANPVKMPLRLPKNFTFARRFFPISLTAASRRPKLAPKTGLISRPESTHRCISCNNIPSPGVSGADSVATPV